MRTRMQRRCQRTSIPYSWGDPPGYQFGIGVGQGHRALLQPQEGTIPLLYISHCDITCQARFWRPDRGSADNLPDLRRVLIYRFTIYLAGGPFYDTAL